MKSGAYEIYRPEDVLEDETPTCFERAFGMKQDKMERVNIDEVVSEEDWENDFIDEVSSKEVRKNYYLWLINANPMEEALCHGLRTGAFNNKEMISKEIRDFLKNKRGKNKIEKFISQPTEKIKELLISLNGNKEVKGNDRLEFFKGKAWEKIRSTFAVKYSNCPEFLSACIEQESNPEVKENLQCILANCLNPETADITK